MGIVDYFIQNPSHLFYTITGVSLLLELTVMGMSGPLLFVSLGALVTGVLISLQLIHGWEMAVLAFGVLTALAAVILWRPFRRFQNASSAPDMSSDMIGRVLPVTQLVTRDQGAVSYSGVEWQVRLKEAAEPVAVGAHVKVLAVDGGLLLVCADH